MKTTQIEKTSPPIGGTLSVAQRRDELLVLRCMNAALTGLLATNTKREDGFFYDAVQEVTLQAEALGLEMFDRFKKWRKQQRAIVALKSNPKVVVK